MDPKLAELNQRVTDLGQKTFPPDLAPKKDEIMRRLGELAAKGDAGATEYLSIFTKKVEEHEQKMAAYNAFLDPVQRRSDCEKISEEMVALRNLINSKIGKDKKALDQWQPVMTRLNGLSNKPTNLQGELEHFQSNGGGEAQIKGVYAKFEQLQADKKAVTRDLKALWIGDKQKQLQSELKAGKDPNLLGMASCLGADQFLEMAQMAEIMATNFPGGFNPFKPEKGRKGAPTEPMTLAEVGAIYGYSTQDFTILNGILRGLKKNPAEAPGAKAAPVSKEAVDKGAMAAPAATPDYRPYIDACVKGLAKLPSFSGTAVRADASLHPSIMQEIIKSGTRSEKAFMSTGLKKVPGFGNVVTNISGIKTGKEITAFSLHAGEGEMLFPPGSVFRFVSYKPGDGSGEIKDHAQLANLTPAQLQAGEYYFTQVS